MIPRIAHSRWRRTDKFAFGRGNKARDLRIFVDEESLPDSSYMEILRAFATHPQVEVVGTHEGFRNRLTVGPYDVSDAFTPWDIEFADGRRVSSAVPGPDIQRIGREASGSVAAERGERAAAMLVGAGDYGVDAFATADPLLLELLPRRIVESGNPMPIDDAVSLLGLFLRVRNDFALDLGDRFRYSFDRSGFTSCSCES